MAAMFVNGSELSQHFNRGPSIDAPYQVSVHLAEGFQRGRLQCEKFTDDGRQVMTKAHIAFELKTNLKTNVFLNCSSLSWLE